ncbi:outer membrane protein assembly factor BamA [Anaplasmataceae bacterium AB001_6]|nr:outer membrane protein assembly factor BamA [Anaplasmataceae bacterium AB001_6]
MKIKFFVFFLFCILFSFNDDVCAEQRSYEIKKITIQGLVDINENEFRNYLSIKVGQYYDYLSVISSYRELFDRYKLQDLSMQFDEKKGILHIKVQEGFIVEKIRFDNPDFNIFSYLSISSVIKEGKNNTKNNINKGKKFKILDRDAVLEDINFIYGYYFSKSRPDTKVYYTIEKYDNHPNSVELVYHIRVSEPIFIEKINFFGNDSISYLEILDVMSMREFEPYDKYFFGTGSRYLRPKIDYDAQNITKFYQSKGYHDFIIKDVVITDNANGSINIDFYFKEGDLYTVSDVLLDIDNKEYLKDDVLQKMKMIIEDCKSDVIGNILSNSRLMETKFEIENLLSQKSDNIWRISYDFRKKDQAKDKLEVYFSINKLKNNFIRKIDITGNNRTAEQYIRRELEISEGDVLNWEMLSKAKQKMFATSFFENVEIFENFHTKEGSDLTDLEFFMTERKTGSANVALQIDNTQDGIKFSIGYSENNFLGEAWNISSLFDLSVNNQYNFMFSIYRPKIYDTDISMGLRVFTNKVKRGEGKSALKYDWSYYKHAIGCKVYSAFKITDRLSNHIFYEIKRNKVNVTKNSDKISQIIMNDTKEILIDSSVGTNFVFDYRNFFLGNRIEGIRSDFSMQLAGIGGTENYVKTSISGKYTNFILSDVIDATLFSIYANFSAIYAYGSYYVNDANRFRLGMDQIRGFAISGIGPRDKETDDSLGGQIAFYANAQVNFPLYFFRNFIKASAFVDVGNLYHVNVEPELQHLVEENRLLRISVGPGILFNIPNMGVLRFDWGFPIKKHKQDKVSGLRISFVDVF